MKYLIVFTCIFAVSLALPARIIKGVKEVKPKRVEIAFTLPTKSILKDFKEVKEVKAVKEVKEPKEVEIADIYVGQDSEGNFKLYFKSKNITREEQRKTDGSVVGSYLYKDLEGAEHKVAYVSAPETGFVATGDDLPKPVPEGEELVLARKNHLELVKAELAKPHLPEDEEKPVSLDEVLAKLVVPEFDTLPEEAVPAEDEDVLEAKAVLFAEYKRILDELAALYKQLLQ